MKCIIQFVSFLKFCTSYTYVFPFLGPAFVPEIIGEPLEEPDKPVAMLETKDTSSKDSDNVCEHNSVLSNVTLAGKI